MRPDDVIHNFVIDYLFHTNLTQMVNDNVQWNVGKLLLQ